MTKILATVKAIITRLVFACHGIIAIWQVTIFKSDSRYWYLALPTLLLFLEGFFTLTIKENQEWKWFCPSVFIYLGNVVPAIWLLELHKVDKRLQAREEQFNMTTGLKDITKMLGGQIHLPDIPFSTETWVTLIEQFLMLTLIVGRWLLPKGDLTRDQLSQLLLVYIGTAADIIEFFDSFKDDKIVSEPLLVLLTLGIWSWSLLQFTVVLTATKSRKSRVSANGSLGKTTVTETCCCSIDVCAIMMNIALQDAPFLAFRLLIIIHYKIISYMNVFFTCKNTLVILLQMYRLYVVHSETNKSKSGKVKKNENKYLAKQRENKSGKRPKHRQKLRNDVERQDYEIGNIAIISNPEDIHKLSSNKDVKIRAVIMKNKDLIKELNLIKVWKENELKGDSDNALSDNEETKPRREKKNKKKDAENVKKSKPKSSKSKNDDNSSRDIEINTKSNSKKKGKSKKRKEKEIQSDHSETDTSSDESTKKKRKLSSDSSSEESE